MKLKRVLFFVIVFFCVFLFDRVYATTYKVTLTGNNVALRASNSTSSSVLATLYRGDVYTTTDNKLYSGSSGCTDGWYKINYNSSKTGYVCATYAKIETVVETSATSTTQCETALKNAGFPSSYWGDLCNLKKIYSNWSFVPIKTGLDFSTAVDKESACGKSYVYTTNSDYIDSSCKSQYSSTSKWHPASKKIVAHYMDPRNWLNEKNIFQFEYLKYDNNISSYVSGITSIIKNAAFYTYHKNKNVDLSSIINQAGKDTNVSPVYLASLMLQELGSSNAEENLYSGVYTGNNKAYYGYYNFFNYGVSDSCATTNGTTYCGLSYAKSKGWSTPYKSIAGTSSLLASSYIAVGQYTSYLYKFNVVPTVASKRYAHQYMTNIAAPSSQAVSTYNSYKSSNALSSSFVFYIPVYENMDATINNNASGASGSSGSSGSLINASSATVIKSAGYSYALGYVSGIPVGTSVKEIISNMESVNASVSVVNSSGKSVSGTVATGYKVVIKTSAGTQTIPIAIKGDTSGDGKINALDLLQVQKNILGSYKLSGVYSYAGDTSDDGKINALDLLQVQKNILGSYKIRQ